MATESGPKTIPLEDLFPEGPAGAARQRRTRQPKATITVPGINKQVFVDAFQLASAGLSLAGASQFALSPEEVERMADAWYRLAKEYPAFGKQVVKGNRVTVWGNLFIVNAIVLGKRVDLAMEWWKDRPKKPRQPAPTRAAAPAPTRPTAMRPASPVEPAPEWGPSTPDLTGTGV